MERRLLTFMVASTAFFFFYISLRMMFAPPVKKAADKGDNVEEVQDGEDLTAVDDPTAEKPKAGENEQTDPAPGEAGDDPAEATPAIVRPAKPVWTTLGSMAAGSGHKLLVTINSHGGGIERVELTERDDNGDLTYQRIDVSYGYLGYFAGESLNNIDGVLVNVVGPGTPAALAKGPGDQTGIQVGDVIVAVAGKAIASPDDMRKALGETKPGDEVTVELKRGNAAAPLEFKAKLTEHPLDLIRQARDGGDDQIVGNEDRLSCLLTLGHVNGKGIPTDAKAMTGLVDLADVNWNASASSEGDVQIAEYSVALSAKEMAVVGGKPVKLSRAYSLAPGSYKIGMSVQLENLAAEPQKLAYRLEGVNGLTLEGWWYSNKISPNWGGSAARDIVYKTAADGHELVSGYALLKRARKQPKDQDQAVFAEDGELDSRNLQYVGVDAQYFAAAFIPAGDTASIEFLRRGTASLIVDEEKIKKHKERAVNTSFYVDSLIKEVPPNRALRHEIDLFTGPKEPEVLVDHGLSQLAYYGWFATFAKLLASLLHFLYSIVGNYAVAIILLTVIVRAGMFPLSRKAAVNAQRMQELAPELKKIAEQYKDDMEGRLKAQRELQQRVGFNPMAGCLPMFLQLPIFIGLYRALSVDIALRQAPVSESFSWASNLAGPDMMYYWGDWLFDYFSGRGTGWLGPYFNILPVVVVILFLAQQKMFMPPATDDQTRMTQKVMTFMMLIMGLFFFRVPAGLCLYFITSSLWGMCERIIVKKTLPDGNHFDPAVIDGSTGPKGGGAKKGSLADKIREQIAGKEEAVTPPGKRKRPPGRKKKR